MLLMTLKLDFPNKKVIKMATDKEESIMAYYEEVLNG